MTKKYIPLSALAWRTHPASSIPTGTTVWQAFSSVPHPSRHRQHHVASVNSGQGREWRGAKVALDCAPGLGVADDGQSKLLEAVDLISSV